MNDTFPHYWLCFQCADSKGGVWPDGHCATIMHGTCEYCGDKNVTICPWVDFDWPMLKKINMVAKGNRDT